MKVVVETPARLHFGLIDLEGSLGRLYGGLGMAVSPPSFSASFEMSEEIVAENLPEDLASLFFNVVNRLNVSLRLRAGSILPLHVGLGATTQTSLAIGRAASELYGLNYTVDELAALLERGKLSSVGVELFKRGGFVLDGAKRPTSSAGSRLITRLEVPSDWIVVLAIPRDEKGLSEEKEREVFMKSFQKPSSKYPERISRLVLVKLIPAIIDDDLYEFGDALSEIQQLVGDIFKNVQGGVIASSVGRRVLDVFREYGLVGLGQSSWGPTVYGFTSSNHVAENVRKAVGDIYGGRVEVVIGRPRNRGAEIRKIPE